MNKKINPKIIMVVALIFLAMSSFAIINIRNENEALEQGTSDHESSNQKLTVAVETKIDQEDAQVDVQEDDNEMEKGVVYEKMVFISDYELNSLDLYFNEIEWVSSRERAEDLKIDYENDMPGGFYIYDEINREDCLSISPDFKCIMLNESSPMEADKNALWEFIDYMKSENFAYPFKIKILNGEITEIEQVYLP